MCSSDLASVDTKAKTEADLQVEAKQSGQDIVISATSPQEELEAEILGAPKAKSK